MAYPPLHPFLLTLIINLLKVTSHWVQTSSLSQPPSWSVARSLCVIRSLKAELRTRLGSLWARALLTSAAISYTQSQLTQNKNKLYPCFLKHHSYSKIRAISPWSAEGCRHRCVLNVQSVCRGDWQQEFLCPLNSDEWLLLQKGPPLLTVSDWQNEFAAIKIAVM